jgi:Domain of unknown function (DUF6438)
LFIYKNCGFFNKVIIMVLLTAAFVVGCNILVVSGIQYPSQAKIMSTDLAGTSQVFESSPYDYTIYNIVKRIIQVERDTNSVAPEAQKSSDPRDSAIITMQRNSTANCISPVYSLTIFGNGSVVYQGIKNVNTTGIHTYQIPKDRARELVNEFINIYYFALKDKYSDSSNASSIETVTTSININGRTKTILDEKTSYAPESLRVLEDKIDNITNSRQWTGA